MVKKMVADTERGGSSHLGASGILVVVFFEQVAYSTSPALTSACLYWHNSVGDEWVQLGLSKVSASLQTPFLLLCIFFTSRKVGFLGAHSEEMIKVRLKAFSSSR